MTYIDQPWVILFGGAGRAGVIERMLEEGLTIKRVIVPVKQSQRLADDVFHLQELQLDIQATHRKSLETTLGQVRECNLLSVGFPYIIRKSVYSKHRLAINIHPTLLPKYRGPTTGAYILIDNEPESGSTVHHLEEEADKGAIVAQSRVLLSPFDTVRSLQRKVYQTEPDLIMQAIRDLRDGKEAVPQDENLATDYPKKRTPMDSLIDPARSLTDLFDEIRACDPDDYPAFFYHKGEKVCIRLWRPDREQGNQDEI